MQKIIFEAKKGAIIITSMVFSTMNIKKVEENIYYLLTDSVEVDEILIKRNGGKILKIVSQ